MSNPSEDFIRESEGNGWTWIDFGMDLPYCLLSLHQLHDFCLHQWLYLCEHLYWLSQQIVHHILRAHTTHSTLRNPLFAYFEKLTVDLDVCHFMFGWTPAALTSSSEPEACNSLNYLFLLNFLSREIVASDFLYDCNISCFVGEGCEFHSQRHFCNPQKQDMGHWIGHTIKTLL